MLDNHVLNFNKEPKASLEHLAQETSHSIMNMTDVYQDNLVNLQTALANELQNASGSFGNNSLFYVRFFIQECPILFEKMDV